MTNEAIEDFKGEFDIPTIVYTPFAIFSGLVPLFDINFFNPNTDSVAVLNIADCFDGNQKIETIEENSQTARPELEEYMNEELEDYYEGGKYQQLLVSMAYIGSWSCSVICGDNKPIGSLSTEEKKCLDIIRKWLENGVLCFYSNIGDFDTYKNRGNDFLPNFIEVVVTQDGNKLLDTEALRTEVPNMADDDWTSVKFPQIFNSVTSLGGGDNLQYIEEFKDFYSLKDGLDISPYKNTSELIDAKYPGGVTQLRQELLDLFDTTVNMQKANVQNSVDGGRSFEDTRAASILQETVSSWYYNLRNLALVILLVILVYIGIRIVLSSTAPEKAKYKQMIMNWVVAICILFLLHIIMITILTISENIVEGLKSSCVDSVVVNLPD